MSKEAEVVYKALRELESKGRIKNILWCPNGECLYDDIVVCREAKSN